MTQGEYRVGIDFNPSGNDKVNEIKRVAADLIDIIGNIQPPQQAGHLPRIEVVVEVDRLKAEAQSMVEIAAMCAVKAATKKAPSDVG